MNCSGNFFGEIVRKGLLGKNNEKSATHMAPLSGFGSFGWGDLVTDITPLAGLGYFGCNVPATDMAPLRGCGCFDYGCMLQTFCSSGAMKAPLGATCL